MGAGVRAVIELVGVARRCSFKGVCVLDSWGEFFQRAAPKLRGTIVSRLSRSLRERYPVEDVLQDVYCVALQRLDSFRDAENDGAHRWVYEITRNVILNIHRHELRRLAGEVHLPEDSTGRPISLVDPGVAEEARRASQRAMRSEETALLFDLLDELSVADREVVDLRYFGELTHAEIAKRLGISHAAARQRATRALRKLREAAEESSVDIPPDFLEFE